MADLPFKVFDADNHYYEATDAEAKAMMRDNAWDVITPRSALAA